MALDKPHHTTSELFICFTSRLSSSSSSMKLSKSILSPGHARDQPLSLPTSLSRRLKANGSIKGGQSPATFPSHTGKKRGLGFDNPEPSSPKVTCIGQVKMKTKKKVKQTRSLSNRRSTDISFRKLEQQAPDQERGLLIQTQRSSSVHFQQQDQCVHRNQRWVHLPSTIYEALREFSCLFPCRSSCFTTNNEKEKEEKVEGSREVTRWLVALQDAEVEKTRGIELMVSNHGREEMQSTMRSSRRHVFEDIEFKDIIESVEMKEGVEEEEKARVSICIPPKNALLLMRCRSDPMKMADITSRFWEEKETDEEKVERKKMRVRKKKVPEETSVPVDIVENEENSKEAVDIVMEMETESSKNEEEKFKSGELTPETEQEDEKESEIKALVEEAEVTSTEQVPQSIVDRTTENIQDNQVLEAEKEEEEAKPSFSEAEDATLEVEEEEDDERFKSTIKKVIEETILLEHIDIEEDVKFDENEIQKEDVVAQVDYPKELRKEQNKSILPDCLLLMMCEPKLSMEVSKETWVCSTDFISPEKKQASKTAVNKNKEVIPERRRSIDYSKPAQNYSKSQHLSTMIEQKLVNAKAYEPFVLTRCKSEPMRTAPESCFWKNRKIHEPHRRDKFGVGAAGLGF
ncbi:uncharacterized protein LOC132032050 [Lycium ferocissimum]|uniref:uncharacterized protein LOC132032050 n=1 Tax=Lycium ferocissimum TaxID=112874 RepID=UPI00281559DC|nr:uncharacterized protein LOC132032050 [Lycium ferocissimum]